MCKIWENGPLTIIITNYWVTLSPTVPNKIRGLCTLKRDTGQAQEICIQIQEPTEY